MKEFKQVGLRDINVDQTEKHYPELDNAVCPCCGKGPLNGMTGISRSEYKNITPTDGSPTICCFCTKICIIRKNDGKLSLDVPTEEELNDIKSNVENWAVIMKIIKATEKMATKKQLKGDKNYANFKPKQH